MGYMQEYDKIFMEYMDVTDDETRQAYVYVDEAEKGKMITSLTSKLYDKIVDKVTDIDFGTIPKSRGDITKIENYESMMECITIISDIVKHYGQKTDPIDTVYTAVDNIRSRKALFMRAYAVNVELPIVLYNTIVLSIVSSISFLIATSIEFIKNPGDDTFTVSLDKVAYNKTSQNLLFNDLKKFNISCSNKELDQCIDSCIKNNAKNFSAMTGVALGLIAIPLIKNILPMLQELVYFFYHTRQSVSDYFAVQADLLQMNSSNIAYREDIPESERNDIVSKQTGIANKFRKVSNFFNIDYKKSEKETNKLKDSEQRKYKVSELENEDDYSDSLF